MRISVYKSIVLLVCSSILLASNINAQTVKSILTKMDLGMNKNSQLKSEIEVWKDKKMTERYLLTNKNKNNNQYMLIRYQFPAQWKDTIILMVKEDVWIYDRSADRFMRMPANLAFGGTGFSHGDILRLNISKNYDGVITKEDQVTWTVNLFTTNKDISYYNLEVTINKKWHYPMLIKCFSKSKKIIKTVKFSDVKEVNGIMKPTKYTFLSPYEPDKYTVIKVLDEKLFDYPDYIFNKWVLKSGIDEKI